MRPDAPALNVLLVEDNEIDIEITRRALVRSGTPLQLEIARDGEEALDHLLASHPLVESPRAILLDLRLPGLDGMEVLRCVKTHPELCIIPVVVLTGDGAERSMLRCLDLGGNMYFVKPITETDVGALFRAVEKYWTVMDRLRPSRRSGDSS